MATVTTQAVVARDGKQTLNAPAPLQDVIQWFLASSSSKAYAGLLGRSASVLHAFRGGVKLVFGQVSLAVSAGLLSALAREGARSSLAARSFDPFFDAALPLFFGTCVGVGVVGLIYLAASAISMMRQSYEFLPMSEPLDYVVRDYDPPSASSHYEQQRNAHKNDESHTARHFRKIDWENTGNVFVQAPSKRADAQPEQRAQLPSYDELDALNSHESFDVVVSDEFDLPFAEMVAGKLQSEEQLWISTLAALDERALEQTFSGLSDIIGDLETLDEPDGLEQITDFIPFKTPAGHPEVKDHASYIDYLINQEFSKNSSQSARSTSRRFLHLIEGGQRDSETSYEGRRFTTNTGRFIRSHAVSTKLEYVGKHFKGAYQPRHFAPAAFALEA